MKNLIPSLILYTLCLGFLNFTFSDDYAEFGATEENVQDRLWHTLQSTQVRAPYFSSSVKTACRTIAPENQATAVKKAGSLVKAYFESDDFQKRYNNWLAKSYQQTETKLSEKRQAEIRAYRIKDAQGLTAASIEPMVDIQIQSAETYTGMESMLSSLPADQRAEFKKTIEDGKRNAAFFKKIKPLLKTDFEEFKKQYAEHQAQEEIAQKESELVKNNKANALEYEKWKDPKKVLSARLTEFLEKSKGVDFTAQTKVVADRKKFVNAAYEGKNDIWKLCYRVGPAPTNAARAFAQQWIAALK